MYSPDASIELKNSWHIFRRLLVVWRNSVNITQTVIQQESRAVARKLCDIAYHFPHPCSTYNLAMIPLEQIDAFAFLLLFGRLVASLDVRSSVHKSLSNLNKIWYAGRG